MAPHKFRVSDPVSFLDTNNRRHLGFIASLHGNMAEIITDDGLEFRASVYALDFRSGISPQRVYTKNQLKKTQFQVGDAVSFTMTDGRRRSGEIVRMNPKRARIFTEDEFFDVPYMMLDGANSDQTGQQNQARLDAIATRADQFIALHGLSDWRFGFDTADRRIGLCSHSSKTISMSEQFCLVASDEEITDTILHEIAHALVGPEHGHDQVWRAKAKEIGCSGERTCDTTFVPPKYIMSCERCGWHHGRQVRRRGLICKRCQTPVKFEFYTPERWNSMPTHSQEQ